jgi:hypothetical protein
MMTNQKSSKPHLLSVLITLSSPFLNQCAPTHASKPGTPAVPAVVSSHWVQVSSRPPTFYPRGVSAECPTDIASGEWVTTGDAKGTRYFIPVSCPPGVPRKTLVNEAISARSSQKIQQIEDETRAIEREQFAENAASFSLTMLGTFVTLGQCPDLFVNRKWKEEWKSSKKPYHEKSRGGGKQVY